jgi:hypothetical protein
VGVPGVAITHQDPGERRQHPAGIDGVRRAVPDMHEREVLGAGQVHIGQRAGGAGGGLVGVQQWGGGRQGSHVGHETALEPARRAAADSGQESGGDIDRGQLLQPADRARPIGG